MEQIDIKSFIDISNLEGATLQHIINVARKVKHNAKSGFHEKQLDGMQLAMIFDKSSTRTRVSFEVGMQQLGGNAIYLNANDCQLGRGETIADTARVLSRYVDAIMIRTHKHSDVKEMAEYASVPVINGLTDYSHPCQIMADIMTFEEHRSSISGKKIAWIGDSNNVSTSWIHAAEKFDFTLNFACPAELVSTIEKSDHVNIFDNAHDAAHDSDLVTTDTWVSMGDDDGKEKQRFADFQVDKSVMEAAKDDAIFMHCLPAHRGEEVSTEVIDGKQSVVWDEAENRLHIQKAILLWCLNKD